MVRLHLRRRRARGRHSKQEGWKLLLHLPFLTAASYSAETTFCCRVSWRCGRATELEKRMLKTRDYGAFESSRSFQLA